MNKSIKQQLLQKVITDFIELQNDWTDNFYSDKLNKLNDNIKLVEKILYLSNTNDIEIDNEFIQTILDKMDKCKTCKCSK